MLIKTIKKIGLRCFLLKIKSRIIHNDSTINSACNRIGAYNYLRKYKHFLSNITMTPPPPHFPKNRLKKYIYSGNKDMIMPQI